MHEIRDLFSRTFLTPLKTTRSERAVWTTCLITSKPLPARSVSRYRKLLTRALAINMTEQIAIAVLLVSEPPRALRREAPWPVRRGGIAKKLYTYSLSIAFFALFAISIVLHAVGGANKISARWQRRECCSIYLHCPILVRIVSKLAKRISRDPRDGCVDDLLAPGRLTGIETGGGAAWPDWNLALGRRQIPDFRDTGARDWELWICVAAAAPAYATAIWIQAGDDVTGLAQAPLFLGG